MFSWFKNPRKTLQRAYEAKLQQAMQAQRNGDMRAYADLSKQAEAILVNIRALDNK